MDYEKARQEAIDEKEALTKRREEIDQESHRLRQERALAERRLMGLKHVLEGLTIMTTEPPPPLETVFDALPTFAQEPPRKALPFPISFFAGLVMKKDRKDLQSEQLQSAGNNGAAIVKADWEGAPHTPSPVEPRPDKREWLG